jgi:hypothetical protein
MSSRATTTIYGGLTANNLRLLQVLYDDGATTNRRASVLRKGPAKLDCIGVEGHGSRESAPHRHR